MLNTSIRPCSSKDRMLFFVERNPEGSPIAFRATFTVLGGDWQDG